MSTDFGPMQAALFDQFAVACTIQRGATGMPVPGRCVVDDGVARLGEYNQVIGRARQLSFIKAEWDPARGDIVTIDAVGWSIEAIDEDDGLVVKATVIGNA